MQRRAFLGGLVGLGLPRPRNASRGTGLPRPTASQLRWQRAELAMFCHFGVNTFTDREWGEGSEDPGLFDPAGLDADQWARSARTGGFRTIILTAKHHDGFCLWPTATTRHSVASSPWRGGGGDVVAEVSASCRKAGLGFGVYLSPWDRNAPSYGDSARYNDLYLAQLTELLTRYGAVEEVWFDGANGEGPNGRRQEYDWPRVWGAVRRLAPEAVMFSDAGPDVRWIGNERGIAGEPCWSTVDPGTVPYPGADGPEVIAMLQHGDPAGSVWRPGESDVSIRPGWFWHPAEDDRVREVSDLLDLYATSVGRNSKLLLNVPPTREGLISAIDAARLAAFGAGREAWLGTDLAHAARLADATGDRGVAARHLPGDSRGGWSPPGRATTGWVELRWNGLQSFDTVSLGEAIVAGQRVGAYSLAARGARGWQAIASGTTIGHRRLDRFAPVTASGLRLTIRQALDTPVITAMSVHSSGRAGVGP
jgi:alpha-L-fucosidase